jgi:membrane-bound inhibitor of C-type lysozyme
MPAFRRPHGPSTGTVLLVLLPLSLVLGACGSTPDSPFISGNSRLAPAPPPPVSYRCDDGTAFNVVFQGEQAFVTLADGSSLALPQQRAASGIWYGTAQHSLRAKGTEATWTVGRRTPSQCQSLR